MTALTAAQAADLLRSNPTVYSSFSALKDLVSHISIDSPNTQTVGYSGPVDAGFGSNDIIEAMVSQHDKVRVINTTEAAKFMNLDIFYEAVARVAGTTVDSVKSERLSLGNEFLYNPSSGVWTATSIRFMGAASGDVRIIAPFSSDGRVLAIAEMPTLLQNPAVTKINGIPKEVFQSIFDRTGSLGAVNRLLKYLHPRQRIALLKRYYSIDRSPKKYHARCRHFH